MTWKVRCRTSQAIRLKPDLAAAFDSRGTVRAAKGDMEGALQDYNEAIRLETRLRHSLQQPGPCAPRQGDVEGAVWDYNEAIRLGYKPKD